MMSNTPKDIEEALSQARVQTQAMLQKIREQAAQVKGLEDIPNETTITEIEKDRADTLKNDQTEKLMELQEKMFDWVKFVVTVWLGFIVVFLCLYVFVNMYLNVTTGKIFIVDKEIIITLLATTTLNILGLPFVITQYLFKPS